MRSFKRLQREDEQVRISKPPSLLNPLKCALRNSEQLRRSACRDVAAPALDRLGQIGVGIGPLKQPRDLAHAENPWARAAARASSRVRYAGIVSEASRCS